MASNIVDKNVSVKKIQEGITYLNDNFMKGIVKVGEGLIEEYINLSNVLKKDTITKELKEQQDKLEHIKSEFRKICEMTGVNMDSSSKVIAKNQETIEETLSHI